MEAYANFRFLIPLKPGDRVALFGSDDALARCLREDGAQVTMLNQKFKSKNRYDHIIIPALNRSLMAIFPEEVARILHRSGTVLIGFRNRLALERLLFWRKKSKEESAAALSWRDVESALNACGLLIIDGYGIRDLSQPQHLVSLHRQIPSRFFFNHMFFPRSFVAAAAQKAASILSMIGLHRTLYRYIAVVATKSRGTVSRQSFQQPEAVLP